MSGMKRDKPQSVLLFDGVCNLCNSSVDFIIRNERNNDLKFASLQSEYGQTLLNSFKMEDVPDSLVFYDGEQVFFKSEAALKISKYLKRPYRWLGVLNVFPLTLRNWAYDWIAKNRYRWFGKKDTCRLPSDDERVRFLG